MTRHDKKDYNSKGVLPTAWFDRVYIYILHFTTGKRSITPKMVSLNCQFMYLNSEAI